VFAARDRGNGVGQQSAALRKSELHRPTSGLPLSLFAATRTSQERFPVADDLDPFVSKAQPTSPRTHRANKPTRDAARRGTRECEHHEQRDARGVPLPGPQLQACGEQEGPLGPLADVGDPGDGFAMQLALGLTELWRVLRPDENRLVRRASRVLRTHQGR
jgi:hypothetical protein